jgi:hypothetical protein
LNAKEKTIRAPGEDPARRAPAGRHVVAQAGRDDGRWIPVYVAVIVVAVLLIMSLWLFSRAFSS